MFELNTHKTYNYSCSAGDETRYFNFEISFRKSFYYNYYPYIRLSVNKVVIKVRTNIVRYLFDFSLATGRYGHSTQ